jgi:molybdenum cofactor cytidylyltransferase
MISSVQTALKNIRSDQEAILIMLADQPMVDSAMINKLIEAWFRGMGELLAPSFGDKRGNPVIFGRRYFDELHSLPRGSAPRELLRLHEQDLTLVEVESNVIHQDLDRLDDYERWRPKSSET